MFNKKYLGAVAIIFVVIFIYVFITVLNIRGDLKQEIQDLLIKGNYQEAQKLSRFLPFKGLDIHDVCNSDIGTKMFQNLYNVKDFSEVERLVSLKYKASQVKKINVEEKTRIPYLTHYVWATSDKSPKEITGGNIKRMKDTLTHLSTQNPNYIHYLWVNDRKLIPNTIKELSSYKLIVKEMSSLRRFKEFQDVLIFLEKFNFASYSDFVRLLVTEEFGGIYMDVDVRLYKDIKSLELVHKFFDLFMVYGIDDGYEALNGFFVVAPDHILIKNYLLTYAEIVRGRKLREWQTLCNKNERVYSLGPPLLTA